MIIFQGKNFIPILYTRYIKYDDINFLESKIIDCDPPYNDVKVKGTAIMSPNYPNEYDSNKECVVTITYAINETIAITFVSFDIEVPRRGRDCDDYLAIYDGKSIYTPRLIHKLCGTRPAGTTIRSTGNAMTLHFHTDVTGTRAGFKLYANAG